MSEPMLKVWQRRDGSAVVEIEGQEPITVSRYEMKIARDVVRDYEKMTPGGFMVHKPGPTITITISGDISGHIGKSVESGGQCD